MLKFCRSLPSTFWRVHYSTSKRTRHMSTSSSNKNEANLSNINSTSMATAYTESNEPDLFTMEVTLHRKKRSPITVRAVYEDSHGSADQGNQPGQRTVIFVHGSPGSHKDFKYITPMLRENGVRTIAINWPGMGYSGYCHRLRNDNEERTEFVQAILNRLDLRWPVIFVGHSRGAENALRLAAENENKTLALVAVNFVGLRIHKGVRPFWAVRLLSAIWEGSYRLWLQPLLSPIYKLIYNDFVGLRTANGYIVGRCLATMCNFDWKAQLSFLERLQRTQSRLLFAYSGQDFLIEPEISQELLATVPECKQLISDTQEDDDQIIADTQRLIRAGHKNMAVFFAKEGHFLQKNRCHFLAQSILELFEATEQQSVGTGGRENEGQQS